MGGLDLQLEIGLPHCLLSLRVWLQVKRPRLRRGRLILEVVDSRSGAKPAQNSLLLLHFHGLMLLC